jgi:hypothetical protein
MTAGVAFTPPPVRGLEMQLLDYPLGTVFASDLELTTYDAYGHPFPTQSKARSLPLVSHRPMSPHFLKSFATVPQSTT